MVTLSDPIGGTFSNDISTVTGRASTVTTDLDALSVHATESQVPAGQTVTTGSTINDTNSGGRTPTDGNTSVVRAQLNGPANGHAVLKGTPGGGRDHRAR